jgi:hypothetical protein
MNKHVTQRILYRERDGKTYTYLFGGSPRGDAAISDCIDWEYTPAIFAQGPTFAGKPPLPTGSIDAEVRSVGDSVPPVSRVEVKGSELLIDGVVYGERKPLRAFLNDLPALKPLVSRVTDEMVSVVTREYVCPVRKRAVLRKGRAYGAPWSLCRLTFDGNYVGREELSSGLLELCRDAAAGNRPWLNRLDRRHEEFLRFIRSGKPAVLEYRLTDDRLFL